MLRCHHSDCRANGSSCTSKTRRRVDLHGTLKLTRIIQRFKKSVIQPGVELNLQLIYCVVRFFPDTWPSRLKATWNKNHHMWRVWPCLPAAWSGQSIFPKLPLCSVTDSHILLWCSWGRHWSFLCLKDSERLAVLWGSARSQTVNEGKHHWPQRSPAGWGHAFAEGWSWIEVSKSQ